MKEKTLKDMCTTYIDMKDMLNDCLVCKEKALIHQKQIVEICRIIKRRMEDDSYDPNIKFRSQNDVISIFARRGAGKTTFVKSLINELRHCPRERFHGVVCDDLAIIDVIEPNQVQKKENFMIRFLSSIHSEFVRMIEKKNYSDAERKAFEDVTNELYAALPVVEGIGKLSLYSDWDDSEYVADKFMKVAEHVKDLEVRFHKYIHKALQMSKKKFLLFTLDDCDVNIEKTFEILETIRLYFTSPQVIVVMTGDSSLYGMTVRRNYWQFFDKELLVKECDHDFSNKKKLKEYRKMVSRLETQYLQKMIKPEHRIVLDNVFEKYGYNKMEDSDDNFRIVVKFSIGKEMELKAIYFDIFNLLGLVEAAGNDSDIFVNHLLNQPFRNQFRVLSMYDDWLKKTHENGDDEDVPDQEEQQALTDKFLNVFEVYINLYSSDNKYLMSKTPIYSAWITKFLIENNVLSIGSHMLPVMEEGGLNNALIALSASCTRQIGLNMSIAFDYMLRVSLVRQVVMTLGMDMKELNAFAHVFFDSGISSILGDIHALVNAKLNYMPLSSVTDKTEIFGSFVLKSIMYGDDFGARSRLIKLCQLVSISPNAEETYICSFYRLLASLAELWRAYESKVDYSYDDYSIETTHDLLKKKFDALAQISTSLEPDSQKPLGKNSHKVQSMDKEFHEDDFKSVNEFISNLEMWMDKFSQQVELPPYCIDRIFSRMYDSFKNIDASEELSVAERMSLYVVAFWNACIVEESIVMGQLQKINIAKDGDVVGIFITNYKEFEKEADLEKCFASMMISCPLLRSYVDPNVLALLDNTNLSLKEYYILREEKHASQIGETIKNLSVEIEELDKQIDSLMENLVGINRVQQLNRKKRMLEAEIDNGHISFQNKNIHLDEIDKIFQELLKLEKYVGMDSMEIHAEIRNLRLQRLNKNQRVSDLSKDKDFIFYREFKNSANKPLNNIREKVKKTNARKSHLKFSVFNLLASF